MKEASSPKQYKKKESNVDRFSATTYSLVVGTALDIASGLGPIGILTSRAEATALNLTTGGWYGKWRNFLFNKTRTTKESPWLKKRATDFLAFNTFQTLIYGSAVTLATLVEQAAPGIASHGIDYVTHAESLDIGSALENGKNAMIYLASISPIIEPTMNYTMNKFRKWYGLSKPEEIANEK